MIWLKRILPLVLIVVGWLGYTQYRQYRTERFYADAERYALVTAKVWLASAQYRDDPGRFSAVRDSLLAASDLSRAKVDEYLKLYDARPEAYSSYVRLVKKYIDSLATSEGFAPADTAAADTTAPAETE